MFTVLSWWFLRSEIQQHLHAMWCKMQVMHRTLKWFMYRMSVSNNKFSFCASFLDLQHKNMFRHLSRRSIRKYNIKQVPFMRYKLQNMLNKSDKLSFLWILIFRLCCISWYQYLCSTMPRWILLRYWNQVMHKMQWCLFFMLRTLFNSMLKMPKYYYN